MPPAARHWSDRRSARSSSAERADVIVAMVNSCRNDDRSASFTCLVAGQNLSRPDCDHAFDGLWIGEGDGMKEGS
jgi:hypothetical protein